MKQSIDLVVKLQKKTSVNSARALSITVPTSAKAGKYTVTIKGTSGSLTHSTSVTATVSSNDQGQH